MAKQMHEYSGEVTVTLKKRLSRRAGAGDESDFRNSIEREVRSGDALNEFDAGDIKDIEGENVKRVD